MFLSGGSNRQESASKFTQVTGRNNFLVVVGLRAPSYCWLLVAFRPKKLPSAFWQESHMGLPSWLFISSQLAKERVYRMSLIARWSLALHYVILGMTSHLPCHILLIRSKSQVCPHSWRRDLIQDGGVMGWGSPYLLRVYPTVGFTVKGRKNRALTKT